MPTKETEWTGLDMKQGDKLRENARERRAKGDIAFQLPTAPLALVRFFYSEIEKKPCPEHLLEGVPGYEPGPAAEEKAKLMADELGLDLRLVLPSGPGGKVTAADVEKHVKAKWAKFTGGKKNEPANMDFLGDAKK
jgi:pyruvate/2-oxoglutarate dehydrogenase complex dihydrolipoamide acyltransferase (E2) component